MRRWNVPDAAWWFVIGFAFAGLLMACNHHSHHIKGVPAIVPCDDGDHASPTGEGHHDKPCRPPDDE